MTQDEDYERHALEFADRLATMSDAEVRAAYLANDAEADDPWQSALAVEIQSRGLDI